MNKPIYILVGILLLLVVGGAIWYGLTQPSEVVTQSDQPVLSVTAYNQTKNADASQVTASESDVIEFNLIAENQGNQVVEAYTAQVDIGEISKSATLIDAGGASYNSASNSLVWPPRDIPAESKIEHKFSVRVIDSTATTLNVRFNNEVVIALAQPTIAGANSTDPNQAGKPTFNSPPSGTSEILTLCLALIATMAVVFVRHRKSSNSN